MILPSFTLKLLPLSGFSQRILCAARQNAVQIHLPAKSVLSTDGDLNNVGVNYIYSQDIFKTNNNLAYSKFPESSWNPLNSISDYGLNRSHVISFISEGFLFQGGTYQTKRKVNVSAFILPHSPMQTTRLKSGVGAKGLKIIDKDFYVKPEDYA